MIKLKIKVKDIKPFAILTAAALILYSVLMFLPIIWGMFSTLKEPGAFLDDPVWLPKGLPDSWSWGNFKYVADNFYVDVTTYSGRRIRVNMLGQVINTLYYAAGGAVISTIVPAVMAYMTAKFPYKFSKLLYWTVIVTMILPIVGAYPSEFSLLKALGIYDKMWGNWIQKFNFMGMYFLIFYASFKGVSTEFSEAAYIDGASEIKVLINIMLPLIRNVLFSIILIKFIELWNDYQTPLLYLPSYPTLAYGVYYLSNTTENTLSNVPMRMASCLIMVLPIFILFVLFRNRLIGNISMGGIKE